MAVRKAMRLPQVLEAVGVCKASWYQGIKDGVYPKGTKINPNGRTVVWFDDVIAQIQDAALAKEAA